MKISAMLALLLGIVTISLVPVETLSRAKKPGGAISCTCTCRSDEKVKTQSGFPLSKASSKVTFSQSEFSCGGNDGGGCRVKTSSGRFVPGTLLNCVHSSN